MKVKAEIQDIKLDRVKNIALISVKITKGRESWYRPFRLILNEEISFDDFRKELTEVIKKDLRIEKYMKHITGQKKRVFTLEI